MEITYINMCWSHFQSLLYVLVYSYLIFFKNISYNKLATIGSVENFSQILRLFFTPLILAFKFQWLLLGALANLISLFKQQPIY